MLRVMNIIYAYGLTQFILLRILLRMICTTRRRVMAFSHETAAARISHAIISNVLIQVTRLSVLLLTTWFVICPTRALYLRKQNRNYGTMILKLIKGKIHQSRCEVCTLNSISSK